MKKAKPQFLRIGEDGQELDEFLFCAKALSKDKRDMRPHVKFLFITPDNRVLGTNGKRLHAFKTERELESGYYEVVRAQKQSFVMVKTDDKKEYPEFEKILDTTGFETIFKNAYDVHEFDVFAKIVRFLDENRSVNLDYVRDVLMTCKKKLTILWKWNVLMKNGDEMIIMENDSCIAVIMPVIIE